MELAKVFLIGLAAWRISALISYERGPGDIFLSLREAIGFEHEPDGEVSGFPDTFWGKLVACVWCLSVWVVPVLFVVWTITPLPVYLLAAMSVTVAVERWNRHG